MDYGALGLTRVVMKLRFSPMYTQQSHKILEVLSNLSYLVAYAGTMPNDLYIVHAGVPTEFTEEFHRLMESLRDRGMFMSVEFYDCNWFRVAPMRAECFNFDEGVWDFDWSNPPPIEEKAARATISEKKPLDKVDLLIVKELWKDSNRSLVEIREAIKKVNGVDINYKTLGWHFAHHVLGHHLIRDYSITWHGMKYNSDLQQITRVGKHGYLGASLILREANEQEKMLMRGQLNRLPFLWSEASGEVYYAQLFFPLEMINEALEYLKTLLKPYGDRAELFILDRREMTSFTIGYQMWDERSSQWSFDRERLLGRLENTLLKVADRRA